MNDFSELAIVLETFILDLAPALAAGCLLGVFFFTGLWWTVRKLGSIKRVALWFLGSLLLRTSIVLLGFYFFLGDSWQHLLTGMLGFIIARSIILRHIRIVGQSNVPPEKAGHAS